MSQIRRKSTGNKGNTTQVLSKDQDSEIVNDRRNSDKQVASTSAKSTKTTGVPQVVTRQPSIREQLKSKPQSAKGNKCTRDKGNPSPQKSPPKKRMNSGIPAGGATPTDSKQKELNPDHEELKRQIFGTSVEC